jgi:hypothetical protein
VALLLLLFSLLFGFFALGPFGGEASPPTLTVTTAAPVVMTSAKGVQAAMVPLGAKNTPEAETVVRPGETVTIRSAGRTVVQARRCEATTPSASLRGRSTVRWRVPAAEARYVIRVSSPARETQLFGLVVDRTRQPGVSRWTGPAC